MSREIFFTKRTAPAWCSLAGFAQPSPIQHKRPRISPGIAAPPTGEGPRATRFPQSGSLLLQHISPPPTRSSPAWAVATSRPLGQEAIFGRVGALRGAGAQPDRNPTRRFAVGAGDGCRLVGRRRDSRRGICVHCGDAPHMSGRSNIADTSGRNAARSAEGGDGNRTVRCPPALGSSRGPRIW